MEPSSVLVFSSVPADNLAKALEVGLTGFCGVRRWKEEKERSTRTDLIGLLLDTVKRFDFAIMFLTSKDPISGPDGSELQEQSSLGGLLVEYGLLIGCLGRERCFLAANKQVADKILPDILKSVTRFSFEEPSDFTHHESKDAIPESITTAMAGIVSSLKDNVQKFGPMKKKTVTSDLISLDQLFAREMPEPDGNLTTNANNVVLASLQPGEMVFERARRVYDNIEYGIAYVYFFPGEINFAGKLAQLLQMLLLSRLVNSGEEVNTKDARRDAIRNHQSDVVGRLRGICQDQSLRIYFLPQEPALQFCIHNANDVERAVAYFKYDVDLYIQLALGEKHRNDNRLWKDLQLYIPTDKDTDAQEQGIFRSTVFFKFKEAVQFTSEVKREIRKCFPEIAAKVEELCFNGCRKDD